jgi:glycosyltransferase involved in cell wall biosynthesis
VTEQRHLFITPPMDGPPTGGTIYDARLMAALRDGGTSSERLDVDGGRRALASGHPGAFWVDSLYLDLLPALARAAISGQSVGLIAHYLPSLVARGEAWTPADLTFAETAALHAATAIVVPSPWLADVLESAGVAGDRVRVVEPGVEGAGAIAFGPESPRDAPLAALLVANVVPGKGIAPFLEALAACLGPGPSGFVLVVVGSLEQDPAYAAECRAVVRSCPSLEGSICFASALPHAEVFRALGQSHVLVSASRMESYGMALAEARALGVPILARRGGNVSAHVELAAGGELFDDDAALGAALVRLSRDRDELARRRSLALAKIRRRTWSEAARSFLDPSRRGP